MNHFQKCFLDFVQMIALLQYIADHTFLSELLCFVCAYNYINKVFIQRTVLFRKTILSVCTHTDRHPPV